MQAGSAAFYVRVKDSDSVFDSVFDDLVDEIYVPLNNLMLGESTGRIRTTEV